MPIRCSLNPKKEPKPHIQSSNNRTQVNSVVDFIWNELHQYIDPNGLGRVFTNDISTSNANISLEVNAIELHPNPSDNQFEISGMLDNYHITIIDPNGNVSHTLDNTGSSISVNIRGLPSGLYFIQIRNLANELVCVRSIIKQ